MILQHTDCGLQYLARHPEKLASYFEIPIEALDSKAVLDPYTAVRIDVESNSVRHSASSLPGGAGERSSRSRVAVR